MNVTDTNAFVTYLSTCFDFSELSDFALGMAVVVPDKGCRRSRGETGLAFSALALSCRIFADLFRAASVMRTSGATFFILNKMIEMSFTGF